MYYVYILTNINNSVIYVGVTNDIKRRIYEHKNNLNVGFTKRYHIHKLVYYEEYFDIKAAISREKVIKGWKRSRKNELIESVNSEWEDLSRNFFKT